METARKTFIGTAVSCVVANLVTEYVGFAVVAAIYATLALIIDISEIKKWRRRK